MSFLGCDAVTTSSKPDLAGRKLFFRRQDDDDVDDDNDAPYSRDLGGENAGIFLDRRRNVVCLSLHQGGAHFMNGKPPSRCDCTRSSRQRRLHAKRRKRPPQLLHREPRDEEARKTVSFIRVQRRPRFSLAQCPCDTKPHMIVHTLAQVVTEGIRLTKRMHHHGGCTLVVHTARTIPIT